MLEHVSDHDRFHAARQLLDLLEIGHHRVIEVLAQIGDAADVVLASDGAIELIAHRGTELATGGAEVEERAAAAAETPDQLDQNAMAAAFEILEGVDVRHGARG